MAQEQKPLTIVCHEIKCDSMEVTDERTFGIVAIRCFENDHDAACSLNQKTARELFNWLGIWLHKNGGE